MTLTLQEAIDRHGIDVLEHLDRQATIPILTGFQVQGDVAFIPTRRSAKKGTLIPAAGVALVEGANGGHTHLLLADGPVTFAPVEGRGADVGVIDVPKGAAAFVAHPEHGYTGHGPGAYIVRRQRERADEIRLVQD